MSDNPESKTASEPIQLADLQRQLSEERAAREAAETASNTLSETVAKMASDTRRRTFTAEVMGKSDDSGIRWFGEADKHIAHLESLAKAFGEDSDEVKHYVAINRSHAKALTESGAFSEVGHSKSGDTSADAQVNAKVKVYREAHPDATHAQAFSAVIEAEPSLVRKIREEAR